MLIIIKCEADLLSVPYPSKLAEKVITTNTNGIPAKSGIEKYRETSLWTFKKNVVLLKHSGSEHRLRYSAAKWRIKYSAFIKSNREQHIKLKSLKIVSLRYISFVENFHRAFQWYYFYWWRRHCIAWKRRRAQQRLISWKSRQKLLTSS